jgi:hypothetical protein
MEIVTSWMEQGVKRGKSDLVLRMLRKRFGSLDAESEGRVGQLSVEQLEELAEALLDFSAPSDLATWLDAKSV